MKIPATRMIQVSYRKWIRLKSQVDWKLQAEIAKERKEMKAALEKAEQRTANHEAALSRAQDMAIKWMDKYEEVLKRYHGEFK